MRPPAFDEPRVSLPESRSRGVTRTPVRSPEIAGSLVLVDVGR
jgi:hypothetical protein